MLLERLFIFLPGFLLITGFGFFTWIVCAVTSRKSKKQRPKTTSNIKAVLTSAASPPETISFGKFDAFLRTSRPVTGAVSVKKKGAARALASEVYPEPFRYHELVGELKALLNSFKDSSENHISSLNELARCLPSSSAYSDLETVDLSVELLKNRKEQVVGDLQALYEQVDHQLAGREQQLDVLVKRYNSSSTRFGMFKDASRKAPQERIQILHNLHKTIRAFREESHQKHQLIESTYDRLVDQQRTHALKQRQIEEDRRTESTQLTVLYQEQIKQIEQETDELQSSIPRILSEKGEQEAQITAAIELLQERMEQETQRETSFQERFKRHLAYRIARSEKILADEKEAENRQVESRTADIKQLEGIVHREEEALRQDLAAKKNEQEQQRAVLEKIRAEHERTRDQLQGSYEKAKSAYETDITVLKKTLEQKTADYQHAAAAIDTKHREEKQRLVEMLRGLQESWKREQDQHARALAEHDKRIQGMQKDYRERVRHIAVEGREHIKTLTGENAHLKEYIKSEQRRLAFNEQTWNDHRATLIRDKDHLEEMLRQLEKKHITGQDKQHSLYVMESAELNQQIKTVDEQLEKTQAEYRAVVEKQNWDLECFEVKENRRVEQARVAWQDRETQFSDEKQRLEKEKEALEQQIEKSAIAAEKRRQELVAAIKNVRRNIAQKQDFSDMHMHQRDRDYKKLLLPQYEKIKKIRTRLISVKQSSEPKIAEKDEMIKTLKLRLAWRDERQQASEGRRLKEIEKIRQQLNADIDVLRTKSKRLSVKQDRTLEPYLRNFDLLTGELSSVEERLEAEKNAYEEMKKYRIELEAEISQIHQRLPMDMAQYANLLDLKEKQIKALNREITRKERDMDTEEIISRDAMQRLRASYKTLKLQANKVVDQKEKTPSE